MAEVDLERLKQRTANARASEFRLVDGIVLGFDELEAIIAALKRAERLEKDLRHYGRHTSICAMEQWFRANLSSGGRMGYCPDCDCGWQDALAALEEE